MRLSPSLRKTLRALQSDIEHIRTAVAGLIAPRGDIQELTNAVRDTKKTNQLQREHDQNQLFTLRAKEQVRNTGERYNRRYQRKGYVVQVWLAVGTWLAFTAAAIYAALAYEQWQTLGETYNQIKIQTDAAQCAAVNAANAVVVAAKSLEETKRQNDLLYRQLIASQAPVMDVQLYGIGQGEKTGKFAMVVENKGHAAASEVHIDVTFDFLTPNGTPYPGTKPLSYKDVWHTVRVHNPMDNTIPFTPRILTPNSPEWNSFAHAELIIRVTGKVTYPNGFGKTDQLDVCGIQAAFTDSHEPNGRQFQPQQVRECKLPTWKDDFSSYVHNVQWMESKGRR